MTPGNNNKNKTRKPFDGKKETRVYDKTKRNFDRKDGAFDRTKKDSFSKKTTSYDKPKKDDFQPKQTELTIEKLGNDFEGVAYVQGKRYLVDGALPKEKVKVTEIKKSGNIVICKLDEVKEKSPLRIVSPCKYSSECGACSFDYVDKENQRKLKTDLIKRRLNDYRDKVEDIRFVDNATRNKIQFVLRGASENVEIGFFNSETHKVVDIPECLMHDSASYSAVRDALKLWCKKYGVIAYNPHRQRGNIRFAVVRLLNGAVSITLVFYKQIENGLDYLYSRLKEHFSYVSLNVNINDETSNAVFKGTPCYYMGEKELVSELSGIYYYYSAGDFLQTNTSICEQIYKDVVDILVSEKVSSVVDAYSGIGITSVLFAKNRMKVTSVEISENAVETAKKTAKLNKEQDIKFFSGDFSDAIEKIDVGANTAIFVDPPRAGLGEKVCRKIIDKGFEKVLYLSCEPDTLVKDLSILTKKYSVNLVRPYDMFPSTKHIETLVMLTKN